MGLLLEEVAQIVAAGNEGFEKISGYAAGAVPEFDFNGVAPLVVSAADGANPGVGRSIGEYLNTAIGKVWDQLKRSVFVIALHRIALAAFHPTKGLRIDLCFRIVLGVRYRAEAMGFCL